ncbi:MAG TPA: hypothetical protein VNN24_06760 [Candidatus Binatus sp.]|nr:hypothetical protein [Candidatus Binatus sp.]
MGKKKEKSLLVLALLALWVGIFTVWYGHASLYDVHQVSGAQAEIFGVANIIFSAALLLIYFRRRNL